MTSSKRSALTRWLLAHPRIGNSRPIKWIYLAGWEVIWWVREVWFQYITAPRIKQKHKRRKPK